MKKVSFLFVLILSFNALSFAQFKEGYIITNDDETVNGYLNFEGSIINSGKCEFRLQPDSEIRVYNPGEIKSFRFNDSKFFSSREIPVNNQSKTVFLEWLLKGRASVLVYQPSVSEIRYFLLTEDNSLIELTNSIQNVTRDNSNYEIKKQEYKNTLSFYLRDCPTLKPNIEATMLNSKSLIHLTKEYHARTCDSWDCIIYEDRDRKLKYSFGISGSFLSSHLVLNSGKPEVVSNSNNIGYGVAIKAENIPGLSPKFAASLKLENYSSLFCYDTTVIWSAFPELLKEKIAGEDRLFEIKFIRMPIQITYRFTQNRLNPFIGFGSTFNFRYSYTRYSQFLIDYALDNNGYDLGSKMKLFQLGLNSSAGFEYVVKPKFTVILGYDFEYCFRFFGGTVNDYTRIRNNFMYVSTYYKF